MDGWKHVAFWGSSDDLIEVEGDIPGCDEYNGEEATFEVGGLNIKVAYGIRGCWFVSVQQVSEDTPVTASQIVLSLAENGYSMKLGLAVPEGSYVSKVA